MALTIICVRGASSTGKSSTIREFTEKHLKYRKDRGDVLGIFHMSYMHYVVGVSGFGDTPELVRGGLEFLTRYRGLKVIVIACHLEGSSTFREVERFAKKAKVKPRFIDTEWIASRAGRRAAIRANVRKIRKAMPVRPY